MLIPVSFYRAEGRWLESPPDQRIFKKNNSQLQALGLWQQQELKKRGNWEDRAHVCAGLLFACFFLYLRVRTSVFHRFHFLWAWNWLKSWRHVPWCCGRSFSHWIWCVHFHSASAQFSRGKWKLRLHWGILVARTSNPFGQREDCLHDMTFKKTGWPWGWGCHWGRSRLRVFFILFCTFFILSKFMGFYWARHATCTSFVSLRFGGRRRTFEQVLGPGSWIKVQAGLFSLFFFFMR